MRLEGSDFSLCLLRIVRACAHMQPRVNNDSSSPCGCVRGTCDEWRGVCECPIGFEGERCAVSRLPACLLGTFALPIRSWVLHAFHDGAGLSRWAGPARSIGPVSCQCLQQFVSVPFLLERTRLQFMRGFSVRCLDLPPSVELADAIARPVLYRDAWRRFSFKAAHDSLVLGVEPSLRGVPIDQQNSRVGRLARKYHRSLAARAERGRKDERWVGGYPPELLRASSPALISSARLSPLPMLSLRQCSGGCGGRGWCEASRAGGARCGCFFPGGLVEGVGGPQCDDRSVWLPARQPPVHWGPSCALGCSGRALCDWQGFCTCPRGYWGIDCALTWSADRTHVVVSRADPPVEDWSTELSTSPGTATGGAPGVAQEDSGGTGTGGGGDRGGGRRRGSLPPRMTVDQLRQLHQRRFGGGTARAGGHAAKQAGRALRRRRPLIYVVDMPPLLRFGVDFAAGVEERLSARMLRSAHRAPTVEQADYLWVPGAPLVIDGHRLLARLWHVRDHWVSPLPPTASAKPARRAGAHAARRGRGNGTKLALMPLLTERASMDSFQLSYADADREEWPALERAPHVVDLASTTPACAAQAASGAVDGGNDGANGWSASGLSEELLDGDALVRELGRALEERRSRLRGRTLGGLFGHGGYNMEKAARAGCVLPPDTHPASPARLWAGLQFNGAPRLTLSRPALAACRQPSGRASCPPEPCGGVPVCRGTKRRFERAPR